ncbi:hypothetical protein CSOJ01_06929 [Colletotrichum sojae]|uniref:Uncharacterized protein n=1 Tax=Colletotrichum sojae TaxID=2175907 RepID=A0A8H6JBA7_9PEZI|nr:hypothetical protein CSOJ01_06929 [Colletotrichum sojae]
MLMAKNKVHREPSHEPQTLRVALVSLLHLSSEKMETAVTLDMGCPIRLPYEVFLIIIDAFIVEAESEALFIGSYHRERFKQLCPVLHVNQDTRRMVLRTFQPIKFRQPGSYKVRQQGSASDSTLRTPRRPEVFWALFSLDRFTAGSVEALLDLDTVMETSSAKFIEFLDDMTSCIFDEDEGMGPAVDNIFSLPNLREINFSLGFHDSKCRKPEPDEEPKEEPDEESFPMAMDGEMFDLLSISLWREPWIYGHVVKSFLCRATAKAVAVFGWRSHDESHHDKVIEISCPSESEDMSCPLRGRRDEDTDETATSSAAINISI